MSKVELKTLVSGYLFKIFDTISFEACPVFASRERSFALVCGSTAQSWVFEQD